MSYKFRLQVGHLVAPLLLDMHMEPLLITPVAGVFSLAAFKVCAWVIGSGLPVVRYW